ncbi:basic amino acid ABC transporter substrate-binding protein [Clostridium sp. MD294]|uniref:basic amino acid ABC transporter substrate-binding protein n=1 Tax=Clostridium sp. MD294 TaxID=97138 RepID=UPI0002CB414B|nr:basic amino acid ABC transporter substrate-binding protein [Clostridium sp. MD294]USF30438.1 Membrane-bound lytic murein transglycosylase F [Clostridium sp. MD294]
MKKHLKTIFAFAMATTMIFAAVGCGSSSEPASDEQNVQSTEGENEGEQAETPSESGDVLVMATNAEFPPYEFYEGGDVVGIDVEIARAVAESMGKELHVEDMAFDSIIPALLSGKADIGAAGMTVTEDRKASVDFTDTYVKASQVIIVKSDNTEITGADSVEGKVIGVQLGTTGDLYASDVTDTVERYNKGFEAVQALSQGKIDAVIIDDQVAKALAADNADVKVLDEPFTEEEYAIAVKKDNAELVEEINAALTELKESGKLQEIVDKYITAE